MIEILIVEDDKTIAMGIEYSLKQEGFQIQLCYDMASAMEVIDKKNFKLVILDLALPDGNGFELCRAVKEKGDIPVVFLTACDDEVNVVMGLDMGGDDYITKPFRIRELVSRIKTVLRRYSKTMDNNNEIILNDLRINTATAEVYKGNEKIFLTTLEYKLLLTLATNKGQVLSRRQILEYIWDVAGDFVNDNTLTVYIKRLREKIEKDPQNPMIIKTIRGMGYKVGD